MATILLVSLAHASSSPLRGLISDPAIGARNLGWDDIRSWPRNLGVWDDIRSWPRNLGVSDAAITSSATDRTCYICILKVKSGWGGSTFQTKFGANRCRGANNSWPKKCTSWAPIPTAAQPTKSCTDHDSAVALFAGPLGIDSCAKVEPVCGQAFDLTPYASMIPDPDTASGTAALSQLEEQLRSDLTALLTAAKGSGEALQLAPVLELACPKTCKVEAVCAAGTRFLRGRY